MITKYKRIMFGFLLNSSAEDCRELGEIFLSFVDAPRDDAWKAKWQDQLEQLPLTPEEQGMAEQMEELTRANDAVEAARWRTGWHEVQMRRKLEEIDWQGAEDRDDPPLHLLRAERTFKRELRDKLVRALRAREGEGLDLEF